jgi:hypothetical protein
LIWEHEGEFMMLRKGIQRRLGEIGKVAEHEGAMLDPDLTWFKKKSLL